MEIPKAAASAYHWMGDCDGPGACYLCGPKIIKKKIKKKKATNVHKTSKRKHR